MKSRYPVVRATLQAGHTRQGDELDLDMDVYLNLQATDRIPPDVGFSHDVLQPVAELKERFNLEQTRECWEAFPRVSRA